MVIITPDDGDKPKDLGDGTLTPDTPEPQLQTPDAPPQGAANLMTGFDAQYHELETPVDSLAEVDFFADADASRCEDRLNWIGHDGALWDGGATDNVAALYEGQVHSSEGGTYRFDLIADDHAQLYVDGVLVLDSRDGAFEELMQVSLDLQPGTHDIQLRYLEQSGESTLSLDITHSADLPEEGAALMALLAGDTPPWDPLCKEDEAVDLMPEDMLL